MLTLLGGIFGGLFRILPEVLKMLDAKNERAHELAMIDKNIEADKLRAQQQIAVVQAEGQVMLDKGGLDALTMALKGQADMAVAAGGRIAALSASVRPVATYYLLMLYGIAKTGCAGALYAAHGDLLNVLTTVYTVEDQAMLSGILNFWFLDRVIKKQ